MKSKPAGLSLGYESQNKFALRESMTLSKQLFTSTEMHKLCKKAANLLHSGL